MNKLTKKFCQIAIKKACTKLKPEAAAILVAFLPEALFDAPKPIERQAIGFLREEEKIVMDPKVANANKGPLGFGLCR